MLNLKNLLIIFLIGFFLSILAGLFGRVNFGILFLRALLSGCVFTCIAFVATMIFNKFLLTAETLEASPSEAVSEAQHSVDVVVDEELPDSATAPAFNLADFVESPKTNTDETVVENVQTSVENENSGAASFQSGSLASLTQKGSDSIEELEEVEVLENADDVQLTSLPVQRQVEESAVDSGVPSSSQSPIEESNGLLDSSDSELGELPDIDSLAVDEEGGEGDPSEGLIEDSVFAETGALRPSAEPVAVSEMGDAKDIAAAIRTAMAKDA